MWMLVLLLTPQLDELLDGDLLCVAFLFLVRAGVTDLLFLACFCLLLFDGCATSCSANLLLCLFCGDLDLLLLFDRL